MSILTKIFGDPNEKVIKTMQPMVDSVNALAPKYKEFSDDELRNVTAEFVAKFESKTDEETKLIMEELLPDAFAVVREATTRVLGMTHYDVQVVGGIVLHKGQIAEMKTGEGKTLVAILPLFLNALTKRGAQLITVNDYLSSSGAGWTAPVFYFLGLSTGVIVHDSAKKYDPDFVDDMQYDERLKNFAPVERGEAYACDVLYGTNNEFGFDYLRDNMVPSKERMVQRGLQYAIVDEVDSILIDEARTPLIISAPAAGSLDRYAKFTQLVSRLKEDEDYNIDEKMKTATLTEEGIAKMEKWLGVGNIYTTGGVREVHHIEQALKAHALFKHDRDYVVKDGEVIIVDEFTGRMMNGRRYSEGLHQAIESKEGVKIQRESETLATITFQNYFRMYKKLAGMTGTAVTEAEEFAKIYSLETTVIPTHKQKIRLDKNDFIYKTEEAKYNAVVAEAKMRSEKGQPVLIGTISIERNEMLTDLMLRSGLKPELLNAKNHQKEAKIIANAGKVGAITIATNMAGRGVDINLGGAEPPYAEASDGMSSKEESEEHKAWQVDHNKVVSLGGLHVIGTERHESRRIDNQLRGRAGRQGDPGSSQFYVSMDDDLMRIFGGDRMKRMMTTLKVPDDMPIENKIISKSIESAQSKVEGNNFDVRKHLVEYDDVINKHREAVYNKRAEILNLSEETEVEGDRSLSDLVLEYVESEIEQVVIFHTASESIKDWDIKEIYQVAGTIFPVEGKLEEDLSKITSENPKIDKIKARTKIIEHLAGMAKEKYMAVKNGVSEAGHKWNNVEKSILIRSIDTLWIEHLDSMSSVRQGIGLRGYGQRDPLIEYKKEAYMLYNGLNDAIQKEVVYSIYKVASVFETSDKGIEAPSLADRAQQFSAPEKTMSEASPFGTGGPAALSMTNATPKIKNEDGSKVGRNDPCPCGSGKKFKKCCGK